MAERSAGQRQVEFRVTYDGPGIQAGRMEVRDLAPAMLAMGELLDHSAQLLNGATSGLRVEIAADFRAGSFGYGVVAVADLGKQIVDSIDIGTLLTLLGITGGGGALGFLRWLRGRKVSSTQPSANNSTIVRTTDGESTVIENSTLLLINNSTIRVDLGGIVEPLHKEGIDELRLGRGPRAEATITKEEVGFFEPPPPSGEVLQDKTTTEIVQVVGVFFEGQKKWRLRMADGTPFAAELDKEFMRRVERHEVIFGAGDALEVEMHTVVRRDGPKLSAEREIKRVVRHIPATMQLELLPPTRPAGE